MVQKGRRYATIDLAGAAAQRCDPKWRAGISRNNGAVACL